MREDDAPQARSDDPESSGRETKQGDALDSTQPPVAPADAPHDPKPGQPLTPPLRLVWLAGAAALMLLLTAGVVAVIARDGNSSSDARPPAPVAPLDLSSVSPEIAELYRFAADHEDELSQIPCFCGCEKFLGHRHLYDCFVRADGAGWDAHAVGCGVCIGEAVTARQLLDDGLEPSAVREGVIAEFGTTPTTAPAPN
jgi:hypothetical protein